MLAGFLTKIDGYFDKGYVLGAIFPLILAGSIVTAIGTLVVGAADVLGWFSGLAASELATLTTIATLSLFLAAFVLRTLRTSLLNHWSGTTPVWQLTGLGPVLAHWHERRRDRMKIRARAPTLRWENKHAEFIELMRGAARGEALPIPDIAKRRFQVRTEYLRGRRADYDDDGVMATYESHVEDMLEAKRRYSNASMAEIAQELAQLAKDLAAAEIEAKSSANVEMDLYYDTTQSLRPTILGNILAALDAYPYWRYSMEGGVFWPHLDTVIKDPMLSEVRDQRILLDFSLAFATLLMILAAAVLIGGPWLNLRYEALLLTLVFAIAIAMFYRVAVSAAIGLSRALRAGCDLYRRDLLKALASTPKDLAEERELWKTLSQVAIYRNAAKPIVFGEQSTRPSEEKPADKGRPNAPGGS